MTNEDRIKILLIQAEVMEKEVDAHLQHLDIRPPKGISLSSKLSILGRTAESALKGYAYLKDKHSPMEIETKTHKALEDN